MARILSRKLVVALALLIGVTFGVSGDSPTNPPFLLPDRGPDGNRLITQPLPLTEMRHTVVAIDSVSLWAVGYQTDDGATWYVQTNVGDLYRVTAEARGVHIAEVPGAQRDPKEPLFLVPEDEFEATIRWVPAPVGERPLDYLDTGDLVSGVSFEPLEDAQPAVAVDSTWIVLTSPTSRYAHGILGDRIEGGAIAAVATRDSAQTVIDLAPFVAEERGVLLYDLDHDGQQELITILSDTASGSRVVAFDLDGTVTAQGDPIGLGFRWRHLIGAGPLGPEGESAVVAVRTPHIGGSLEYLVYSPNTDTTATDQIGSVPRARLTVSESRYGYSSHTIGSQNLGDAVLANVDGGERFEVILPTQARDTIAAVGRTAGGSEEVWRFELGARMSSNLAVAQEWPVRRKGRSAAMLIGTRDGSLHVWW